MHCQANVITFVLLVKLLNSFFDWAIKFMNPKSIMKPFNSCTTFRESCASEHSILLFVQHPSKDESLTSVKAGGVKWNTENQLLYRLGDMRFAVQRILGVQWMFLKRKEIGTVSTEQTNLEVVSHLNLGFPEANCEKKL